MSDKLLDRRFPDGLSRAALPLALHAGSGLTRSRRDHVVDPRVVFADRRELRAELRLWHRAGADHLQVFLVARKIAHDLQPDPIRIEEIKRMNGGRNGQQRAGDNRDAVGL
jgi:hypothetical protein